MPTEALFLSFSFGHGFCRRRATVDSSQTVFLVDDDEGAPFSVVALLQAHEFDCRGFDSASAFLSAYDPRMTGCLVTDLAMPGGLAGIELHRELQHREVQQSLRKGG